MEILCLFVSLWQLHTRARSMTAIEFQELKPAGPLSSVVESFWMLSNNSGQEKPVVIVPDGRIDVSFSFEEPHSLYLLGLETEPAEAILAVGTRMFAVSFRLLALEYLFDKKFPGLLNSGYELPSDYFGVKIIEFEDFDSFCERLSTIFSERLKDIDPRKQRLFDLIYMSHGTITVQEIADQLHWSSRQINRYFNEWFGITLKAYCNILRFRSLFQHIKEGRLYPDEGFADQAHFIKDVKRFAGTTPKKLNRNENDRFIQFSTLKKK